MPPHTAEPDSQSHTSTHEILPWQVTGQFVPTKPRTLLTDLSRGAFKNTPEWEGAFSISLKFHLYILASATLEIYFHHSVVL